MPPLMVSFPPRPRMQSAPLVPLRLSLLEVPLTIFVPGGQHDESSPRIAVTRCVPVVVLPAPSRAVQVTVVVPSGNVAGLLLVIVTGPTRSVAVAVPMFAFAQTVIVRSGGTVSTGGTLSPTVTVKLPWAVLPAPSRAEQLTVVVPAGKRLPLAGMQATPTAPDTVSLAVGVNLTTAVPVASAWPVIGGGSTSVGRCVSRTMIVARA